MADKGKLIAGMSGGGEHSRPHCSDKKDKKVGVVYDELMLDHKPDCEETPERIKVIWEELERVGLLDRCEVCPSSQIEDSLVEGAHSKEYATRIRRNRLIKAMKDNSVWMTKGSSIAAACAAGSLVEVCRRVVDGRLDSAFAIVRPPGHHAESNKAMGFCLYNNVAIAAKFLLKEFEEIKKILIVDWDYHHGNGTQKIFLSDSNVLYFSVHGYGDDVYPGSGSEREIGEGDGKGYTINVPFEGVKYGDADYFVVWEKLLLPIAEQFKPDIILISAGFDAANGDTLGKFSVTRVGYSVMLELLLKYAKGKLILALEGGYDVKVLSKCVKACITTLLTGKWVDKDDEDVGSPSSLVPKSTTFEIINKVSKQIEEYWDFELQTPVDNSTFPSPTAGVSAPSSSRGFRLKKKCIFKKMESVKFEGYLSKLLKEPKMQISVKAAAIMNSMVNHLMEKILLAVVELKRNAKDSATLRSHDIQYAVRLVFPEERGKHAQCRAKEAQRRAKEALQKFAEFEGKSDVDFENLLLKM